MPEPKHAWSSAHVTKQSGTPTESPAVHDDYSLPLYDEVNGMPDMPDTVPWCPEEDVASVVPMHGAGMDSVIPKDHRLPRVSYMARTFHDTNGTSRNESLGFPANSVIVSNWTPQWAKVAGEAIPPYTIGWVFRLNQSETGAKVSWEVPTGFTQPASVTGALLRHEWCEELLTPKPGVPIYSGMSPSAALNTSQVSVTTGSSILAANGARRTVTIFNTAASGGNVVYIGSASTVTTSTGGAIPPQTGFTLSNYSGAIFGSATGGSATTVTVTEESA